MDNLLARIGQLISPIVKGFIRTMSNERGEVVIPFMESVAEEQRPAVTQFVTNSGATTEELAPYTSFDEFLSGYKPAAKESSGDWTTSLDPDTKALVGVKGWKTPGDAIKSYAEVEKLVGHEKIAMPKKDKNGNYDPAELSRVMAQLGMPKDPKEYKPSANFKLPEGIQINEKLQAEFNAKLHKAGFLPHQYALVMDEFANLINQGTAAQKEAGEKAFNEAMLNLRTKWGSAYDQKAKLANGVLLNFADPAKAKAIIAKYGNNPELIEVLANIGGNLSEEALSRTNMSGSLLSPEEAKIQKNSITGDPMSNAYKAYFDAGHPQHEYFVNKVAELNIIIAAGQQ